MRKAFSLLALLALVLPVPSNAALVWSESTSSGYPITNWTRSPTLSQALADARAYAGGHIRILAACRQPGWYAYVGSENQFQRGISCGFETKEAALFKARNECRYEGGRCDLERLGYDKGLELSDEEEHLAIPDTLPGGEANAPNYFQLGAFDLE